MDGMISIAEAIDRIAGSRFDHLTDEAKIEIDDVLEAASALAAGQLPIHEFAKVGVLDSPATGRVSGGYTRYAALLSTPVTDPRRQDLRRAIDSLLAFQGLITTSFGIFEAEDLAGVPVLIRRREDVAA
jgi:hypothetical protein